MDLEIALVVGESLVDVVHERDGGVVTYPGGSAANVAVALARLERATWFATALADDEYGRLISKHLERAGVRMAGDPGAVDHTSSAIARIGADGAASYTFDLDWRLSGTHLADLALPTPPVVVHACSIGAVLEPGAETVVALVEELRPTTVVSYDVNARPAITGTGPDLVARVERLIGLSDVVKASDEDLEALWPDRPWRDSVDALLALGPAAVVVTRGGAGSVAVGGFGDVEAKVPRVEVADTIGAGDTFGAAVLDALWTRQALGSRDRLRTLTASDWTGVLEHAAAAAAITVSRPGADPPYRSELG